MEQLLLVSSSLILEYAQLVSSMVMYAAKAHVALAVDLAAMSATVVKQVRIAQQILTLEQA
jgi:hypothetical protein